MCAVTRTVRRMSKTVSRESSSQGPTWHELAESRKRRGSGSGLRLGWLGVYVAVVFTLCAALHAGVMHLAQTTLANSTLANTGPTNAHAASDAIVNMLGQTLPLWLAGGGTILAILGVVLVATGGRQALEPMRLVAAELQKLPEGKAMRVTKHCRTGVARELADAFNAVLIWHEQHRQETANVVQASAKAIADLQNKLASHTAQLENANERLSSEIAEKEDFLRAVSHDLNAPLRNIGGMVSMLMLKNKDQLPTDVIHRLERVQKNVEVETDLINELLELSRIKTRRQSLALVDTEQIVWELRGIFENDLKTRHIDLIVETSLPALYAERARMRQVFQNLIDNAIKYMGDFPTREIRIGCNVSVKEAEFYVKDTGTGIDPEDLDKVFCVFRRGRGEASQRVSGKGVGLASVKSIVQTYAGRVTVQSKVCEGTTFRFTINGRYVPAVSGQVPTELEPESTTPMPALASAPTSQAA
jgi:signal transduction histidine kinase